MQEEVLKLVLLALEDGSALSRKVLVMFVVQRLEPHFPQASKTSIGHVVQLLYRASCFVVCSTILFLLLENEYWLMSLFDCRSSSSIRNPSFSRQALAILIYYMYCTFECNNL